MSRSVEETNGLGFKRLPPFVSTTCRFVIAKMGQWVGSGHGQSLTIRRVSRILLVGKRDPLLHYAVTTNQMQGNTYRSKLNFTTTCFC